MRYDDIDDIESEALKIADNLIDEVGNTTLLELVAQRLQSALRRMSILRVLATEDSNNE